MHLLVDVVLGHVLVVVVLANALGGIGLLVLYQLLQLVHLVVLHLCTEYELLLLLFLLLFSLVLLLESGRLLQVLAQICARSHLLPLARFPGRFRLGLTLILANELNLSLGSNLRLLSYKFVRRCLLILVHLGHSLELVFGLVSHPDAGLLLFLDGDCFGLFRRLRRQPQLLIQLLPQRLELGQPLAQVVIFKMAAGLRVLELPVWILVDVDAFEVLEIDVVDVGVLAGTAFELGCGRFGGFALGCGGDPKIKHAIPRFVHFL